MATISLKDIINRPSILSKFSSYSYWFWKGFNKSHIYLSLGTPIALSTKVIGTNSLKEELFNTKVLFLTKIWILDLVSKVEDAHEEVSSSSFGSTSTNILFLHNYSYIRMIFSIPLIMK